MSNPQDRETAKQRSSDQPVAEQGRNTRMPFDTSDLNRIPGTTDEDPPYRNWWVEDER